MTLELIFPGYLRDNREHIGLKVVEFCHCDRLVNGIVISHAADHRLSTGTTGARQAELSLTVDKDGLESDLGMVALFDGRLSTLLM